MPAIRAGNGLIRIWASLRAHTQGRGAVDHGYIMVEKESRHVFADGVAKVDNFISGETGGRSCFRFPRDGCEANSKLDAKFWDERVVRQDGGFKLAPRQTTEFTTADYRTGTNPLEQNRKCSTRAR